jgi:hypothetical protein
MANEEHVALLKQGREVWNAWREANPDIVPYLGGADLHGADLHGADLSDANLRRAVLHNADLHGDTDLNSTDLRGADLHGADLDGADLSGANLHSAILVDANLSRTMLSETLFVNTDLTRVKGLETCSHIGPSTIDHRTLQSSGPLPLAFLRGVGLPDNLHRLPALAAEPADPVLFLLHQLFEQGPEVRRPPPR